MTEQLVEPRALLAAVLAEPDVARFCDVRRAYRLWYEATDFAIEHREPWPGLFESAVFASVERLESSDPIAAFRLRRWAFDHREVEDVEDLVALLASTGRLPLDAEVWPFRPDIGTELDVALRAGDAEAVARLERRAGEWADRVGAPWPEVFVEEVRLALHVIDTGDREPLDDVARWASAAADERLWAVRAVLDEMARDGTATAEPVERGAS